MRLNLMKGIRLVQCSKFEFEFSLKNVFIFFGEKNL